MTTQNSHEAWRRLSMNTGAAVDSLFLRGHDDLAYQLLRLFEVAVRLRAASCNG